MAMSDDRQRKMPLPDDRSQERSQTLVYPEAVLLTNPIEAEFKGQVDDKYQYSGEAKDIQVHGWICSNPPTGLWQIVPNNEFRSSGPTKQFLTSHVGPTSLSVLLSTHYSCQELMATFEDGEPWKKVLGPLFVYANSASNDSDWHQLWDDAKQQLNVQANNWPYTFVVSDDYPSSEQRGSVSGSLLVYDSIGNLISKTTIQEPTFEKIIIIYSGETSQPRVGKSTSLNEIYGFDSTSLV